MSGSAPAIEVPFFERRPLPPRIFNLDRLIEAMNKRGVDGLVATSPLNVFYLSGFNPIAHKADEPRPFAVVLSRHAPDHPVMVVGDYYLGHFLQQPTWIEDIRPIRGVMLPLDLEPSENDIDRFIPESGRDVEWIQRARNHYAPNLAAGVREAMSDVGLATGRVGFDEFRVADQVRLDNVDSFDGYDLLMHARQIKTEAEISLLRDATRLNQIAIERTVASWKRGTTWRGLNQAYHEAVVGLGGSVHDPGAMVLAHPRGADPVVSLQTGFEDFVLEPGIHVMFDCHGTWHQYCWDGGKTWVVDGEPEGAAVGSARATADAMRDIEAAMRPGARVSELQATGRDVYRRHGVESPESTLIFFHGLGLSHMDLEPTTAQGHPNADWTFEAGMLVATHLLYPGGERERMWLEDVALVTENGGEPLFTWDFNPMTGSG